MPFRRNPTCRAAIGGYVEASKKKGHLYALPVCWDKSLSGLRMQLRRNYRPIKVAAAFSRDAVQLSMVSCRARFLVGLFGIAVKRPAALLAFLKASSAAGLPRSSNSIPPIDKHDAKKFCVLIVAGASCTQLGERFASQSVFLLLSFLTFSHLPGNGRSQHACLFDYHPIRAFSKDASLDDFPFSLLMCPLPGLGAICFFLPREGRA